MDTQTKTDDMPVSRVEWRKRDTLWANDYNPNNVAPPEMELLRVSLLEDGWTLPLVIRPDGEIVDGFHRWTLSAEPKIYALTGGLVPVVVLLQAESRAHQIASTIRYNRARGNHYVLSMANIVSHLHDELGVSEQDIMRALGMEFEEYDRLNDRGNMVKRGKADQFGNGWIPDEH